MADISVNLKIEGIGSTTLSLEQAKKLHDELGVLFSAKVRYVPYYQHWDWNYPWFGIYSSGGGQYDTKDVNTTRARRSGNLSTGTMSNYQITV